MLVGKQLDGIWHTSVVVHEKEYWFGGSVFESDPGATPFGAPTKITDMPEQTMRTKADLINYLAKFLAHDFTHDSYDVLTHNCNHFSDAAVMFLLNMHIPQEVLTQSDVVTTGTWTMQLLRPILNCVLGRFEATSSTTDLHHSAREEANAKNDWNSIAEGALVAWEYEEGWTRIARVIARSATRETSAEVVELTLRRTANYDLCATQQSSKIRTCYCR
jgi:hypothetical protein